MPPQISKVKLTRTIVCKHLKICSKHNAWLCVSPIGNWKESTCIQRQCFIIMYSPWHNCTWRCHFTKALFTKYNNCFHFDSINNFNHVFSVVVQRYCIMIVFCDSAACFFICCLFVVHLLCVFPLRVCSCAPEQNWSHLVCHVCFHFWQIRQWSLQVIRWEWSDRLWNLMYTERGTQTMTFTRETGWKCDCVEYLFCNINHTALI